MAIKNIIFDLGGVLLNIDYLKTVQAFKDLGLENPEQAFTKEIQAELFRAFEKGEISSEAFIQRLQQEMPHATEIDLINAWNALLGDFPLHRYKFLNKLSRDYKLGVLSNTNAVHEKEFVKTIEKAVGWKAYENLFEGICYSHEMGFRKPDIEMFEACLDMLGFNPSETLFIDDTEEHVLSARKVGLTAIHLQNGVEAEIVIGETLKISAS